MWINPMLTIFAWGVLISLIVLIASLWIWYWSEPVSRSPEDETRPNGSGGESANDGQKEVK